MSLQQYFAKEEDRDEHGRWTGDGGGSESKGSGKKTHFLNGDPVPTPPADAPEPDATGTAWATSGDLAAQGFKPKGRASGGDITGALQVGWHAAKNAGTNHTVVGNYRGMKVQAYKDKKKAIPFGNAHFVVTPEGKVHAYKP
jgi:hypothetical protein